MKDYRRLGAYASFVLGVALLTLIAMAFVVRLGLGFTTSDLSNPQSTLKLGWTLPVINWLSLIIGLAILLLALALRERLQAGVPNRMRLATILASVATALFVGSEVAQLNGWPVILSNAGGGAPAIAAFYATARGLEEAGDFAAGAVYLLWGWAGLATKELPSGVNYLLIASGILWSAGRLSPAIAFLWLFGSVFAIIWSLWLGMILIKELGRARTADLGAM